MTKEEILTMPVVRETESTSRLEKTKVWKNTVHQAADGKFWRLSRAFKDGVEVPHSTTIIEVEPVMDGGAQAYHQVH
jgi:hypothetical protein